VREVGNRRRRDAPCQTARDGGYGETHALDRVADTGGLPQWRAAGGCDARWRGRLTAVDEDIAHGRGGGYEGDDDAYRAVGSGAQDQDLASRDKSRAHA
jgi:hypothetical protein